MEQVAAGNEIFKRKEISDGIAKVADEGIHFNWDHDEQDFFEDICEENAKQTALQWLANVEAERLRPQDAPGATRKDLE